MLPYRLILIFAFIIIRNIRKIKFSFKVLPRFFKSGREFESRALNVLTKQYYFICGRCPVYASLRSALNECPLDIQRPANFFEKKFDKKLYLLRTQLYRYLESTILMVLNGCLATLLLQKYIDNILYL